MKSELSKKEANDLLRSLGKTNKSVRLAYYTARLNQAELKQLKLDVEK